MGVRGAARRNRGWARSGTAWVLAALLLALAGPAAAEPGRLERGDPVARAARLARLRAAMQVQDRHRAALFRSRDVVGTGTSLGPDGEPEIRVFVARRGVRGLPARLDGVAVRTRVSGRFYALRGATCEASGDGVCDSDERWPLPAPIGVSTGHPAITAGTIGARVTDGAAVYALSNNHVYANVNGASPGDPVLQPGSFDGGSLAQGDEIGALADFEPIAFCTGSILFPSCPVPNRMDAAIALASPLSLGQATPVGEHGSTPGYGIPSAVVHAAYGDPLVQGDEDLNGLLGLAVQKYGRTTGPTSGVIGAVNVTADVCYDETCSLLARFVDQIVIPEPGFSAGGDSGSLIVTDDGRAEPVGLLFAGSDTDTLAGRIDLVLDRFGVVIDGAPGPARDAAVQDVELPATAGAGSQETVTAHVRNAGSEALPPFDVTLVDETEGSFSTRSTPALAPGESVALDFDWTPTAPGAHRLTVVSWLADDEVAANDAVARTVTVFADSPGGPALRLWQGTVSTDAWTTVELDVDYADEMVVACTPSYDLGTTGPSVVRVRGAAGDRFDVGLGRPWYGAFPGDHYSARAHCLVVRAGVYDAATSGVALEAVRLEGFAPLDGAGVWQGQARTYGQAYAQPVVLGQVISADPGIPGLLGVWSVFWSHGPQIGGPPTSTSLFVGRHTGEDPTPRPAETLAYVVLEAGSGVLEGLAYRAGVSADVVEGMGDAPPSTVALAEPLGEATTALVSSAGMDGLEGGWPILYGDGAVRANALDVAIEEDWWYDPDRQHPTEQVGYLVFGTPVPDGRPVCGLGFEAALALLGIAHLGRRRRRATNRPGGE